MHTVFIVIYGVPIGYTYVLSLDEPVRMRFLDEHSVIQTYEVPVEIFERLENVPVIVIKNLQAVYRLSNFFQMEQFDEIAFPHEMRAPRMPMAKGRWVAQETKHWRKTFLSDSEMWIHTPTTEEEAERMHVRYTSTWHILCEGHTHDPHVERLQDYEFWSLYDAKIAAQRRSITLHLKPGYPPRLKEMGEIHIKKGGAQFLYNEFPTSGVDGFWDWSTIQEVINRYYWEYEQKVSGWTKLYG